MKKDKLKKLLGLIASLLALFATYPALKDGLQEILQDILWLVGELL